jgi:hypothetical protein
VDKKAGVALAPAIFRIRSHTSMLSSGGYPARAMYIMPMMSASFS